MGPTDHIHSQSSSEVGLIFFGSPAVKFPPSWSRVGAALWARAFFQAGFAVGAAFADGSGGRPKGMLYTLLEAEDQVGYNETRAFSDMDFCHLASRCWRAPARPPLPVSTDEALALLDFVAFFNENADDRAGVCAFAEAVSLTSISWGWSKKAVR